MANSAPDRITTTDTPCTWLSADFPCEQGQTGPDSRGNGQPRILVVDDEDRMRTSVAALLHAYAYPCEQAADAEQALQIMARHAVDLMLLDINMPGMSGMELLRLVARDFPDTSVIILSGESTFDNAAVALRSGAADFLVKPYHPDELVRSLRNTLEKRELERAMRQMRCRLEISEQRHRFIVNNSPDIIYMLDHQGRFTFVNDRITALLGYPREAVIGRHFSDFVHGEDYEKARYAFNERRTGTRASSNVEFRMLHHTDEHRTLPVEARAIPIELNAMGIYLSSDDDNRHFAGTYGVARDISERKRSEALINYQLNHDLLTGLPNRGLFQDRLNHAIAQARRNNTLFALLYMDMDRFKVINDSYGHLVGDELLQAVAQIMRGHVRDSDTLARISGDEFTLLLPQITCAEDASQIAQKLIERFRMPIVVDNREIPVTFSIGIAIYPQHGETTERLVHHADTAMYHVKSNGKRDFAFYDPAMHGHMPVHPAWENELRKAITAAQFEVLLQPQLDTCTGRLLGAEALLRWHHPDKGLVMPNDFIPCAEETGLIVEIGEWVLRESCRLLSDALQRSSLPELTLAINISARQLAQDDFVPMVCGILDEYGVAGSRIELEITENILMQNMEKAAHKLHELSKRGVKIAVDDFGVGYSSLSYLQTLPLHTLKIDRSFIASIQSAKARHSIVSGLIVMARELGLDVVAEGVENTAQLDFLKAADCPRVQGFLLGKPMPVDQLVADFSA